MTKSEQIIALKGAGHTTRQIAIAVYGPDCDVRTKMAYVRVVLNQRQGGPSRADRAYRKTDKGRAVNSASQVRMRRRKRATDPAWHEAEKAYRRAWYARNRERLAEAYRARRTPEFLASERERDRIRKAALANRLRNSGNHSPVAG